MPRAGSGGAAAPTPSGGPGAGQGSSPARASAPALPRLVCSSLFAFAGPACARSGGGLTSFVSYGFSQSDRCRCGRPPCSAGASTRHVRARGSAPGLRQLPGPCRMDRVSGSARGAAPVPGGLTCGQEPAAAACQQGPGAGRPRLPALRARAEAKPRSTATCRGRTPWYQPGVSSLKSQPALFITLLLPLGQRKGYCPGPCSSINRKAFGVKNIPVPAETQHEALGCRSPARAVLPPAAASPRSLRLLLHFRDVHTWREGAAARRKGADSNSMQSSAEEVFPSAATSLKQHQKSLEEVSPALCWKESAQSSANCRVPAGASFLNPRSQGPRVPPHGCWRLFAASAPPVVTQPRAGRSQARVPAVWWGGHGISPPGHSPFL